MRALIIACLLLLNFPANSETIKIGYIDSEEVVNNFPQYQQRMEKIHKEFEPKKQELLDLFKYIKLLRGDIESINNSEKNSAILQEKLSKLSSLEESFKKETEFWQEMMDNKKINLLKQIELLINKTISEIAIAENFHLILYGNAAFVSDEVNITSKVIRRIQKISL